MTDREVDRILNYTKDYPDVLFKIYHVHNRLNAITVHDFHGETYNRSIETNYEFHEIDTRQWGVTLSVANRDSWIIYPPRGFTNINENEDER